jgi:hypothetical protein
VKEGKVDVSKMTVEPYSAINSANLNDQIFLYPWQQGLLAEASKIDAKDPRDVLRPFRIPKTEFDQFISAGKTGQERPEYVLAQYEMVDRIYYDLQKEAEKHPDQVGAILTVRDSRRKLFQAARKLLEPYLKARAALPADQAALVANDRNAKIFDGYLATSKLSYTDFDTAMEKTDDNTITLLRSDSSAVNYIGFMSQADFVNFFQKLPLHEKMRAMLMKLDAFLSTPGGDAKARAELKSIQEKVKSGQSIYSYLPESIRQMLDEQTKYYDNAKNALDYVAHTLLASKYRDRTSGDEFERQYVSQVIHAGGAGFKDSKSFTTNSNLMVNFPFTGTAAQKDSPVSPQISLVRISKDIANVNYGTNTFENEYEFLSHAVIGPNHIVDKWTKSELEDAEKKAGPLTEEAKNFINTWFGARKL